MTNTFQIRMWTFCCKVFSFYCKLGNKEAIHHSATTAATQTKASPCARGGERGHARARGGGGGVPPCTCIDRGSRRGGRSRGQRDILESSSIQRDRLETSLVP